MRRRRDEAKGEIREVGRDRLVWVLFGIALAERLASLLGSLDRGWPFPIFYEGDAEAFYRFAQAILRGGTYDNGIPFHPPFFPLVLAGIHAVSGDPVRGGIVRGILAAASALVPVLLYKLMVRHGSGRVAAFTAGILCALSFGLDVLGASATSEGLYLLLGLALLVFLARGIEGVPSSLVAGAGIGMLALTRAEGILFGVLAVSSRLAHSSQRAQPSGRRTGEATAVSLRRRIVALAAGVVVAVAPWTIHNAVRLTSWNATTGVAVGTKLPTFVPITAYGPLNFALANNDLATGGFQRSLLSSGREQAVLQLGDAQHRRYFLHGTSEGLRWIAGHPGRFLALAGRKLDIASRAFDLGWTPWNLPLGRAGLRRPVDMFSPGASGLRWILLLLAATGAVLLARRRNGGLVVALTIPVATVFISTVLFFGYVRQGALAIPFVFGFAGVALAEGMERLPGRVRAAAALAGVRWVALGLVLAILIIAGVQDRNYEASGTSDSPDGKLLRDAPMTITPVR